MLLWWRLLQNTGVMATPAGFEPAATRLEGECSIQLSYGVVRRAIAAAPATSSTDQLRTRS